MSAEDFADDSHGASAATSPSTSKCLAIFALLTGVLAWLTLLVIALTWSNTSSSLSTNAFFAGVFCALGAMLLGFVALLMRTRSRRVAISAIMLGATFFLALLLGGLFIYGFLVTMVRNLGQTQFG